MDIHNLSTTSIFLSSEEYTVGTDICCAQTCDSCYMYTCCKVHS